MKIRSNAISLDALDYKILEALQTDARQTYTDIGKRLGIAHSTVYDRIRRLEKYGVIKQYTAIIDTENIGEKNITAIMAIYTDPKESEKVAKTLSNFQQILEVYMSLSEELQVIAKVIAKDQEALHSFIANSVAPLPGVLRIRTAIITKKFKETTFSVASRTVK
ncbi:MAG: Lrp/AsnC family transcriptional regulator [Candidatus Bathyarchaeales archaeon]